MNQVSAKTEGFFKNGRWQVYGRYIVLAVVSIFLFLYQYDRNQDLHLHVLEEQAAGDIQVLNLGLRLVTDHVDMLRQSAEGHLALIDELHPDKYEVMRLLEQSEFFYGFAIDSVPPSLESRITGNISGIGVLEDVDLAYERELEMAFALNAEFKAVLDALENTAWVYYTSARGFNNTAPYRRTDVQHVTPLYLTREYFHGGLPAVNPDRTIIWTDPYLDSYGAGMMVTAAKPVYDGENFLGTVAIDVTFQNIYNVLKGRRVQLGISYIVLEDKTVIGRSETFDSTTTSLQTISDVLPDHLEHEESIEKLASSNTFYHIGDDFILRQDLTYAPWTYVVHLSGTELRWHTISVMLPELAIGVLLLIMIIGVERLRRSNIQVAANKRSLQDLSTKLARYVSPQIVDAVFSGRRDVVAETERKKLTVFFSDIKDFTKTTEGLEPEDLAEILNDYLTEMTSIALEYGGTIDKYIGDAMVVFFGDPDSLGVTKDAQQCVLMAVAMQKRMHGFRAKWQERGMNRPFRMRVGINTGYCNVGNFGSVDRLDYTIIGGEVNKAARLETASEPDGILLSHETYSLVKNLVEVKEAREILAKGFDEPVTAYQIGDLVSEGDKRYVFDERHGVRLFVDVDMVTDSDRDSVIRKLNEAIERLKK